MITSDVDARRKARIFRERVAGTYVETNKAWLEDVAATRAAGRSLSRVRNPHIPAASKASLRGVGRNEPCPCGSGRKTKWCCAQ